MVTVGFIVEGDTEATLIKDETFISFLASLDVFCSRGLVINAEGKNKLYHPKGNFADIQAEVSGMILKLENLNVAKIFFLIDFDDDDTCFTQFRSKIFHQQDNIIIIAKQAIEAWFLADHQTLSNYLKKKIDLIEFPELFANPFEEIKSLRLFHNNRGISDKILLARTMIKSGFSLERAASHPNCPSASYFLKKLQSLNTP